MLKEGETYNFKIYKVVQLPDGEQYYLLESPYKSKHLLAQKLYLNYHFNINQFVNCTIDRINCSSRIFIEPEHPIYKINEIYILKFIRFDCIINSKNIRNTTMIMQDNFGEEYICIDKNLKLNIMFQTMVSFKLLRIKKGIFYIQTL